MKKGFLMVLGLATLPALRNLAADLFAEWLRSSKKARDHAPARCHGKIPGGPYSASLSASRFTY